MATPEQMVQTMIGNMKEKTGKTLPQWLKVVKSTALQKHGEIVKHLKGEYGMGHGFANLVAHQFLSGASAGTGGAGKKPASKSAASAASAGASAGKALVEAQYAGPKSDLRPIYDALAKAVQKFGKDVEISPKKTYVSLRRNKQFALVQPSTKTRVDVGINLKGSPAKGRLEKSGSFNAMVSHRVRLEKKTDVDKELLGWLKKAYENA